MGHCGGSKSELFRPQKNFAASDAKRASMMQRPMEGRERLLASPSRSALAPGRAGRDKVAELYAELGVVAALRCRNARLPHVQAAEKMLAGMSRPRKATKRVWQCSHGRCPSRSAATLATRSSWPHFLSAGFATKGVSETCALLLLVCIIAKVKSKLFRPRLARAVISGWRPRDAASEWRPAQAQAAHVQQHQPYSIGAT